MARATEKDLSEAHGYLLKVLIEQIEDYRQGKIINPRSGLPEPIPPQLLANLGSLLKANGIDRPDPDRSNDDLLADELDEFEEDNVLPFGDFSMPSVASAPAPRPTPEAKPESKPEEPEGALGNMLKGWCSYHKEYHDREAFGRNKARTTGLQSECKAAKKEKRLAKKKAAEAEPTNPPSTEE